MCSTRDIGLALGAYKKGKKQHGQTTAVSHKLLTNCEEGLLRGEGG